MNVAGKCGNGLGSCIDVGGLGIVIDFNAVERGDIFEAMLDGFELLDGVAHRFRRGSGQARGADSGKHIFDVVLALERDAAERHHGLRRSILCCAVNDRSAFDPCAQFDRVFEGKPVDLRLRALG